MSRASRWMTAACVVLGCGCDITLPLAPSDLTTGIAVYRHANYLGESAHIVEDVPDLRDVRDGPCVASHVGLLTDPYTARDWNDCISSVRVAPGWSATLYRDDGYRDDSITITHDIPNLELVDHDCPAGGLNDCVTSIRVRRLP